MKFGCLFVIAFLLHHRCNGWDINTIQGCAYDYQLASPAFGLTLGCHRAGGQTVTLKGTFEQQDVSLIAVKFYQKNAPTNTIDCTSVVRQSLNALTCVTPPGTGLFWLPRVISLDTAVVASLPNNASLPDVSLSYISGGLDVVKEGLGLYINFMNPGDSAATFRSGGYMAGLTVNATAGTLDANIWRVQGLNGASMANPCYTASPPTSNNFYVGQCGTFWGFGLAVPRSNASGTYPMYADTQGVFSNNFASGQATFASPSSFTGWNSFGGLTSTQVGGVIGGLMFVPFARNTENDDLVPGSLDMRLANRVGQTITGLSVRYSLQCRNAFDASTTVKLQYAHSGSEDWYFFSVPNTAWTTPLNATVPFACTANDPSCWDNSTFVDAEITGLQWVPNNDFFLRWHVDSTATSGHGDPCRITDIELTPFVFSNGDYSLKFNALQLPYVDVSAGAIAANTNYTIEMSIHPSSMSFPPGSGLARARVTSAMTLVSTWNADYPNATYEWSWVLLPTGYIAVKQQLPTNSSGIIWTSNAAVSFDRWTYLVLQQLVNSTGLFLRVYVGGYLADEHLVGTSMPGLGGTTVYSHIRLGQAAGAVGMEPFIGLMDEVLIWETIRGSGDIYASQGLGQTNPYAQYLKLYLKMDDSSNGTMVNSRRGVSPSTWIVTTPWATAPLSVISSSSTLSLTGGIIQCSKAYIIPGASTTCMFRVQTQYAEPRTMLTATYFTVQFLAGANLGTITALQPDSTGSTWSFVFTAGAQTGTSVVQAYDIASDPLAGQAASIVIVPEGCQGCEYRSTVNGYKVYSCLVDNRRFLRRDIANVAGTCPM
eukprot:EG_transcript_2081